MASGCSGQQVFSQATTAGAGELMLKDELSTNTSRKKFKILQLNVQCISNKLDALEVLFSEHQPDIVSISEHWCSPESVLTMNIPGYQRLDFYCRPNRAHGGSMVYVRSELKVEKLRVSQFSEEMQFEVCGVKMHTHEMRFIVLSVYRPCSGDFELFLDRISHTLNYCYRPGDVMFVCGDLNIDFLKDSSLNHILFLDFLGCFSLHVS